MVRRIIYGYALQASMAHHGERISVLPHKKQKGLTTILLERHILPALVRRRCVLALQRFADEEMDRVRCVLAKRFDVFGAIKYTHTSGSLVKGIGKRLLRMDQGLK